MGLWFPNPGSVWPQDPLHGQKVLLLLLLVCASPLGELVSGEVRRASSWHLPFILHIFSAHVTFFFKNIIFILFIYFWLHWISVAARGLPLVAASGGYSSLWCLGFSLR